MKKEVIKQAVDHYLPELVKIADEIYDLAESGNGRGKISRHFD